MSKHAPQQKFGATTRDKNSVQFVPFAPLTASTTFSTPGIRSRGSSIDQFPVGLGLGAESIPEVTREKLTAIARNHSDAQSALAPAIEILVDGSPQMRAAIIQAFGTNPDLQAQWEKTFELLRTVQI